VDTTAVQRANAAEARAALERNARSYRTSLKCWWAPTYGCIAVLDPFTGEVYEVERLHPNTPRWMTWRAMDEKSRKSKSFGTSNGWRPPASTD
jgi:hypothetical protein